MTHVSGVCFHNLKYFRLVFSFSMTLVDTLDTLAVIGDYDEFERAIKLVIENVRLDSNLVVSVFESNIRMIGYVNSGMQH